ncbi:MAG: M1 family peptidase [Bacteroidetes bacterium]|nr:MAG: M1 family peptidase [Bacteroidota bacterium]
MSLRFFAIGFILLLVGTSLLGQQDFYASYKFTEADTLRGALRPERTCYDVTFYHLNIEVDLADRALDGYVDMSYVAVEDFERLQVDLFANMDLEKVWWGTQSLPFERIHNAVFISFPQTQTKGSQGTIRMVYSGRPIVAANAPWDGGFVWTEDKRGRSWVGVACEGTGASLWWPNKDHLSDEPDSMRISVEVPAQYMVVANGNLEAVEELGKTARYHWRVSYPINNYNVSISIGHYTHFNDEYYALDGDTLALDYYVLDYNEDKARDHFRQVHDVLECFEYYLDKYPFWEDGFALVETPYLGMEHQSGIAYGNKYMRGYLGGMIPRDMNWDYIIVHETGHEYFGNSLSCNDLAEMWIHESFTTYLESLFVEYTMSYADAVRYLNSQRKFIYNREPIIGPRGVNFDDWAGSDHYYKGAWMLHTLRSAIGDDEQWFGILKGFYRKYALSPVTTADFVHYVNEATGQDWTPFFKQYLYYAKIPTLEYQLEEIGKDLRVRYRWNTPVVDFHMPIQVGKAGKYLRVYPKVGEWQEAMVSRAEAKEFAVAQELYLVDTKRIRE